MPEFHYLRTHGPDSVVDEAPGRPKGTDVATVLAVGLPPSGVALEAIAALCEILVIADEDAQLHGDVRPEHLFVDARGRVSLAGFGVARGSGAAPEGEAVGRAADRYGLGYTALCLLSAPPIPNLTGLGPKEHEDRVVDAVLNLDLGGLPQAMQGDVQWLVAKLLAHRPQDRPSALVAWHTFVTFAHTASGQDFVVWCAGAVAGRPALRGSSPAADPTEDTTATEVIVAPIQRQGPLAARLAFERSGDTADTMRWNHVTMKQALASPRPSRPVQGLDPVSAGGSAPSRWSREQQRAIAEGRPEAPRPRRRTAVAQDRTPAPALAPAPAPAPSGDDETVLRPTEPAPAVASDDETVLRPTEPALPQLQSQPPPQPQLQPQPQPHRPAPAPPQPPAVDPAPGALRPTADPASVGPSWAQGRRSWLLFGGGVAVGAVLVASVLVAMVGTVGVLGMFSGSGDAPVPVVAPAPPTARSPALVALATTAAGEITGCGQGSVFFRGPRTFEVPARRLPVTCVVAISGSRTVFVVRGSGTVHCELQGRQAVCDPARVGGE